MATTIRNPVEWAVDQLRLARHTVEETGRFVHGTEETRYSAPPTVQRIEIDDLREALARGMADFSACRTDVVMLCLLYPLLGLILSRLVFGYDMLPLLFPLASGFALLGPVAAVGLYEISRRRERGEAVSWTDAFGVIASPRFVAILVLGLLLLAIFLVWLAAADGIYALTLGPAPPASPGAFLHDVLTTPAGVAMIVIGIGVGFLFAVLVLAISVVSFPLLLDRDVGLPTAVLTSLRAAYDNPGMIAVWGLIVAGGLAAGSLPFFLGLAVVLPILGHATWHLYRRLVAPAGARNENAASPMA
jgi:uncharacterized membrane protein